ncbi:uncharacterized protein TrAFT101_000057 [Trichoderma asperellum]|uniref:uncharacterized protein n=1 Tax=Trichoderma asperellum TaxID=101201 RepID=UPI00332A608F|nr:hypothetical protein TrAFT101_000057 [Trichoderma asperellum]
MSPARHALCSVRSDVARFHASSASKGRSDPNELDTLQWWFWHQFQSNRTPPHLKRNFWDVLLFPVIYIVFPFTSLIESDQKQQIIGLLLIACKCCMTVFAFPCNAILLTNSSASAGTLGTLNGVATSVAEIGRTIGPTMGGLMFNVGVEAGLIVLPWWVMAAIALAAALPVLWMEDRPTPTELAPQSQEHANAVEDCEVGASRRRQ